MRSSEKKERKEKKEVYIKRPQQRPFHLIKYHKNYLTYITCSPGKKSRSVG
jgi:hypothetical protein